MIVKLLTEHNLEFLSLTGGCTGSSESALVKNSNCWKSGATTQISFFFLNQHICCWSHLDVSFEHPKHMLNLMSKKKFTILC